MFNKAQRKLAKLRLGICGASGSGKTWSALLISTGMGGKIALLDTERRGHLYASNFEYDICELDAPYSPERYIAAITAAEKAGYDTLIIDSLSHAWMGEGGVLSIVDKAGGKSFSDGWRAATPKQNALVDKIITSKLHIIVTMRSKTEYVLEANQNGKMVPRKLGMAPVQRDGLEYEFTVFMDLSPEKVAHVTKDNTQLFTDQYIKPTVEMGEALKDWLLNGKTQEEIANEILADISSSIAESDDLEKLTLTVRKLRQSYPGFENEFIPLATTRKLELTQEGNPQ